MINYKSKNLIVPSLNSNVVILASSLNNYIYIYNDRFYFLGTIKKNYFDLSIVSDLLSVIILTKSSHYYPILRIAQYDNTNKMNKLSKKLASFISSWDTYYYCKLKFKGKVYKMSRYRSNNLKLSFGRCHRNLLIVRSLFLKKKKKLKLKCFIFGVNKIKLSSTLGMIVNTRLIDMFTQRGLRRSRQIIYRKIGKKSSYTAK